MLGEAATESAYNYMLEMHKLMKTSCERMLEMQNPMKIHL
jgi:hypothetical protein